MLYSPLFKYNLESLRFTSGIKEILCNVEDRLIFSEPEDYHLTLSYIEFHTEDWSEDIPHKIHQLISSILDSQKIHLPFKRLGTLYKYFFAEFCIENLIDFKQTLLTMLEKEFPKGIYGFEQEYFPHITLGRFYVPPDIPRIIKRELIATQIRGQELYQPHFVEPLLITNDCSLKIGIQLQESNFLKNQDLAKDSNFNKRE